MWPYVLWRLLALKIRHRTDENSDIAALNVVASVVAEPAESGISCFDVVVWLRPQLPSQRVEYFVLVSAALMLCGVRMPSIGSRTPHATSVPSL